jgi:hypothetical protein
MAKPGLAAVVLRRSSGSPNHHSQHRACSIFFSKFRLLIPVSPLVAAAERKITYTMDPATNNNALAAQVGEICAPIHQYLVALEPDLLQLPTYLAIPEQLLHDVRHSAFHLVSPQVFARHFEQTSDLRHQLVALRLKSPPSHHISNGAFPSSPPGYRGLQNQFLRISFVTTTIQDSPTYKWAWLSVALRRRCTLHDF